MKNQIEQIEQHEHPRLTKFQVQRWVTYLRENPDKQTSDCLMNKDGQMCCLGALAVLEGVEKYLNEDEGKYYFEFPDGRGECGVLWGDLGIAVSCGDGSLYNSSYWKKNKYIESLEEYYSLTSMNDNGVTWPEIADFIEKNYITQEEFVEIKQREQAALDKASAAL